MVLLPITMCLKGVQFYIQFVSINPRKMI